MSQGWILEGKEDKGRYEEREERGGQQRPKILRDYTNKQKTETEKRTPLFIST